MAKSIKQQEMKITRFINPSRFFYYISHDQKLKLVIKEEAELQKYFADQKSNKFEPNIGDICAYFYNPSKKWIKVEVDKIQIHEQDHYAALWCLDYGVSLSTKHFDRFAAIPEKFKTDHQLVSSGCLTVLPTKTHFDYNKGDSIIQPSSQWSSKAVELARDFVKHGKMILFISKECRGNVTFGDIEAINDGKRLSLSKILLDRRLAFTPGDESFYEAVKNIDSFKIRRCNDTDEITDMLPEVEEINLKLELPVFPDPSPSCNFEKIFKILYGKESEPKTEVYRTEKDKENINNVSKTLKPKVQPPLLETGALDNIIQQQNPVLSLMDVATVFVHGKNLGEPFQSIEDATFYPETRVGLRKMKMQSIFRTQAWSWPNIAEGRSVFIINGENSGKTFSYLPAILTSVISWEEGEEPSAQGPIGIIIVRSSRDVEILHKYCSNLIPHKKSGIVKAFGKWNCHNKKVDLLNGCDLLITTPPCFSRLAEGEAIRMFSRNRIKHLVFDGLDSMHEIFDKEINDIIKTCTWGVKHVEMNPQLIVTSTSWMNYNLSYMKLSPDPIVIIGSFVEAAAYSKCHFKLIKTTHHEKLELLKTYLKEKRWQTKKTLIVLNSQFELDNVLEFLLQVDVQFIYVDNKCFGDDRDEMCKHWTLEKQGEMSIMLTIDEILYDCKFKCVDVLIHFSLPSNWNRFSRRFATMNNRFMDIVTGKTEERPSTIIMLDEQNAKEIPRLIAFAESRKVIEAIPEDIKNFVKCIIGEREALKQIVDDEIAPICSNVFQFGKCESIYNCNKRHVFTETDKSVNLPVDGLIKFELVGVHKPSHYAIKIKEYLPAGSAIWISCEQRLQKIEESLNNFQETMKENCLIQAGVKINDLCAVFCVETSRWSRCKVLEKQKTENPAKFKAKVECIDNGIKMIVQGSDLKCLPETVKLLDPLVTNLRIVNLIPYDKDKEWDHETTKELKKYFSRKKNIGDYMLAQVKFTVQTTIFADTFEIRCWYEEIKTHVVKYTLTMDLLKKNYCLKDESVVRHLKDLMKRANLYVPTNAEVVVKIDQPAQEIKNEAQPRWKHLTVGNNYQVYVKHFESPDLFYVILDSSSNNVLRKLMKQIESCDTRILLKDLYEGGFCMVAPESQKPKRGLITKAKPDGSLEVFLLDSGDSIICNKDEIYELPAAAVNAAPFQAVQCRLVGVKPKFQLKEWPRRMRALRNFVTEFCGNDLFDMKVVAHNMDLFDVTLLHLNSGQRLHLVLIEEKLAEPCDFIEPEAIEEAISSQGESDTPDVNDLIKLLNDPASVVNIFNPSTKVPGTKKHLVVKPKRNQTNSPKQKLNLLPTIVQDAFPSTLSYIYKHPKIEWRQSEIMIWLSISAIDCVEYGLKVDDSSLKIRIQYKDEDFEYTSIQLFGIIMEEFVSHEKTGQNIIVRLLKKLPLPWSRLTVYDEPNRFITFSHDDVPIYVTGQNNTKLLSRPAGDSDNDDGSQSGSSLSDGNIKDFNDPLTNV